MDYTKPDSIISCAVRNGIFANANYLHDREAFICRVLDAWYSGVDDVSPLKTEAHENSAAELYDFYVAFSKFRETYPVPARRALQALCIRGLLAGYKKLAEMHAEQLDRIAQRTAA